MRKILAISLVTLCCSPAASTCLADEETPAAQGLSEAQETAATTEPAPVADNHALFKKYIENTLGAEGIFGAALGAGLDQWRKSPPEWELGARGFAKRWASQYGQSAISDTTKYAVARLLHHDPSYQRCECTGFGPRLAHAVSSPFMARNRNGDWVLSPAIAAGIVAGHVVPSVTWYPSEHGPRDGLERTGTALLSKIGVRVFREFVHLPRVLQ